MLHAPASISKTLNIDAEQSAEQKPPRKMLFLFAVLTTVDVRPLHRTVLTTVLPYNTKKRIFGYQL